MGMSVQGAIYPDGYMLARFWHRRIAAASKVHHKCRIGGECIIEKGNIQYKASCTPSLTNLHCVLINTK